MSAIGDVDAIVFDVLGTLVDETAGLRAAIGEALPTAPDTQIDDLLGRWRTHVADEQQRIARGDREYAPTDVIDAEAARHVAAHARLTDPAAVTRLATAPERLPAWHDAVAALDRVAASKPVIGLSNAATTPLLRLAAHTGLRWHHTLSSQTTGAYKPDPKVYRLAVDAAGRPPERILMVAAHAWDLRGAQTIGMRTAYVHRPVTDPPARTDAFDAHFGDLDELADALAARWPGSATPGVSRRARRTSG